MRNDLKPKRAAFLAESGFCERELQQTLRALRQVGVDCRLISADVGLIRGWNEEKNASGSRWGDDYAPDVTLDRALSTDFDILVIPGGRRSIEKLELDSRVKHFVSGFIKTGKPVIAYNMAIDLLMFLGFIAGYSVAAKSDLCDIVKTSGARCAPTDFVVSKNLITLSRFSDAGNKIQRAVQSILNEEPYFENVSSENMPNPHKAA